MDMKLTKATAKTADQLRNKEDTMKNKRILAILAITVTLSFAATGCIFDGDEPDEQVVVDETTPSPEPTATPTPEPTIAPNVQDSTYTSSTGAVAIKLPDATWSNKADEADMLSFESPEQGKILILHGQGEEDMSSAVIPNTQDLAVSLEQANDMTQGTDFEIQDYTGNDVNGVGVYSYTVKYMDTEKSGGYAYAVNKIFANDGEYYNICGSVVNDASLAGIKAAVDSFRIAGESTLKAAAPVTDGAADGTGSTTAEGNTAGTGADSTAADGTGATSTDNGSASSSADDGTYGNSAGFTAEQLTDTSQTRTIYRNSDGHPLVITPDGSGNWKDFDGNTYRFANNEDVYDQNDVDYYWHGEGADVYYMPVE